MHRATAFRLIWFLLAIGIATGCDRRQQLVEQHLFEFGTIITITLVTPDLKHAEILLGDIEIRLDQQRQQWHAWEDSDLTRFNTELQTRSAVAIPKSLAPLLDLSHHYYRATGGLFNPALGKLIAAYGFHGDSTDLAAIRRISYDLPGMDDLVLENGTVRSRHPELQIDLGGIAKGYAIAEITRYLDQNGVKNYIVNAGGDMSISGNRFGKPWRIGIQNPFAPGAIASLAIEGRHSIFTSGNYERQTWLGREKIHHIIDPRTGQPSRGQSSATVVTVDPVLADVAATSLMIDGFNEQSSLPAQLELDNYLLVSDAREIVISRNLLDRIQFEVNWPVSIIE